MKPQLYNDGLIELRSRLCKLLIAEDEIMNYKDRSDIGKICLNDAYEGGCDSGRQDAYNDIIIMIDDMLEE